MPDLDAELAALWARVQPVALERAERVVAACDGEEDEAVAAGEAHRLAGSLGMYGFDGAARLAADVDHLVQGGALHDGRTGDLRAAAVALRQAIAATLPGA